MASSPTTTTTSGHSMSGTSAGTPLSPRPTSRLRPFRSGSCIQGLTGLGAVRPPMWESIGAIVMGRHLFDLVNGWEGQPPAGEHVVVVSHRPKPEAWHPEASYHFVDSPAAAIARAQDLAGERTVAVNAGNVGSQILAAGLVDEVAMDLVPVIFGVRQALLRQHRGPTPARGSPRSHTRRPRATPAVQSTPLDPDRVPERLQLQEVGHPQFITIIQSRWNSNHDEPRSRRTCAGSPQDLRRVPGLPLKRQKTAVINGQPLERIAYPAKS